MRAIQKLTQTYLTLSLADIASHVGLGSPAEAEQYILRWARDQQLLLVEDARL
jgi:COP9 signalosome complex subunit 3